MRDYPKCRWRKEGVCGSPKLVSVPSGLPPRVTPEFCLEQCPFLDHEPDTTEELRAKKPRLSVNDLAKVRRCQQAKATGQPCREFETNNSVAGVVVGCYNWPSLAALQIRTIRETCGENTPVLVVDDRSPRATETEAVCQSLGADFAFAGPGRLGHTGGDLSSFWHGLKWAKEKGLVVLAKLSQRFVVTRPGWLKEGAEELLSSGAGLAAQPCRGRLHHFDLRTEACLLSVVHWNDAALAQLAPRRRYKPELSERVFYRTYMDYVSPYYWPWSLITPDRSEPIDGVLWHYASPREDYEALARRHGVRLEEDFSTAGWDQVKAEYVY